MKQATGTMLRTPDRDAAHAARRVTGAGERWQAATDAGPSPNTPEGASSVNLRSPPEKKRRSALHKTEMCVFHVLFTAGQGGGCLEGANCSYAHTPDELCSPSLEDKERRRE